MAIPLGREMVNSFVSVDERLCSPRNSNKHITHTDPGHKIHSFRKRRKSPYTAT